MDYKDIFQNVQKRNPINLDEIVRNFKIDIEMLIRYVPIMFNYHSKNTQVFLELIGTDEKSRNFWLCDDPCMFFPRTTNEPVYPCVTISCCVFFGRIMITIVSRGKYGQFEPRIRRTYWSNISMRPRSKLYKSYKNKFKTFQKRV